MVSRDLNQPLVLYHDAPSGTARAASLPPNLSEDADAIVFRETRFVWGGDGLMFWDYLRLQNGECVGVVLVDFDVASSLESSRLLTASSNVTRDGYGYHVQLAPTDEEPETDGAQAFGSSLFKCNDDCLLVLPDWHCRGYAFPLDHGLINPVA